MTETLDIALPKGRLGEKVARLLGEAGMGAAEVREGSRALVLESDDGSVLEYSPYVSLRDGRLGVPDSGVYDFTQY